MITVTLYTRGECPECQQALRDLNSLQEEIPHRLEQVDVDQNRALAEKLGQSIPLVMIGPFTLRWPFTRQDLQIMLAAARDRVEQMERVDQEALAKRGEAGGRMPTSDRITRFLAFHWLALANLVLLLYVGLPFAAPVLLRAGATLPAQWIYKVYSPMCHQLAFRSWFLFGEQPYYPRALSGVEGVITYEELVHSDSEDIIVARNFLGNEAAGFKVALCQRDVAIYGFMLLFGVFYAVSGRRLRSLPWYVWVLVGMGPIALDGFSQLPSLATGLPEWLPMRESSPLLRLITGGLFGWVTAWYLFPMLEATAAETRALFQRGRISAAPRQEG